MHIHFIQHMTFEYPGSILDWCNEHQHTYTITKIYQDNRLPSIEDFDILVIMGGSMAVYEEVQYAWMSTEKALIKKAIDAGKKILGICLGAQLIAEQLGATVKPHTVKEIGWWPLEKTNDHVLTDHLPQAFTSFHWHGDTFSLPEGAIHLLSSKGCMQQGYVFDNRIAGLQFHMEVKEDLLDNMTEEESAELIKATYVHTEQEIKALADEYLPCQKLYMHDFMNAFAALG